MSSPPGVSWLELAARDLVPEFPTPLTWSIVGRSARRATRAHFALHGYDLPATATVWQRQDGRAVLNPAPLAEANKALFGEAGGPVIGGGSLFGGSRRRYASELNQAIEEVPRRLARVDRWWDSVQTMTWRQATLLQIMEEIEPRAESMLATYLQLAEGLDAYRRQVRQQLAEWLPDTVGELGPQILGPSVPSGRAHCWHRLEQLAHAIADDPAVTEYLHSGSPRDWQAKLPAGTVRLQFEQLLADCGLWAVEPLEVASPRWQDDPTALLSQVVMDGMVRSQAGAPGPQQAATQRQSATAQAARQLGPLRRRQFEPAVARLQELTDLLIACFDHLVTVVAAARFWAMGAAGEAVADGRLAATEDVFYLELEELKQVMTGEWTDPGHVRGLVESRKGTGAQ